MPSIKTLSPKELAPVIGVSQSSIKRWVDAGLIDVTRTAGGHRRILLSEALQFIRKRKMRILRPDLLGLPDFSLLPPSLQPDALTGDALVEVLDSGKLDQARALLIAAFLAGQTTAELFDGPLTSTLQILGERWRTDDSTIYLEHQATQMFIGVVGEIQSLLPPSPAEAPLALGGAPEHDIYLLPSMMAATVLAEAGYQAINLGAQTPVRALREAAADHRPALVWIAATVYEAYEPKREALEAIAAYLQGLGTEVVIGGRALEEPGAVRPVNIPYLDSMRALFAYATNRLGHHKLGGQSPQRLQQPQR